MGNIVSKVQSFMSLQAIKTDIANLVKEKGCGPILIRLSWHDAGVFKEGAGGCPNAVMRFTDGGEGTFGANAGLPDVAVGLLKPIADKYVPDKISNADLWALAANVATEVMGGPSIKTRFGRSDAKASSESVESQAGRLPDGDKEIDHLREIFHPKGFTDKDIVALSGAHTVGHCHLDRSGFDGPWTAEPLKFDNTYFKDLLEKTYEAEKTAKGCPQHRHKESGTMMLISDLALLKDPAFKTHVETYAKDQAAFFKDYVAAWTKLQENGCADLRDDL
jgi:catalase (peroxidase I)